MKNSKMKIVIIHINFMWNIKNKNLKKFYAPKISMTSDK